MLQLATSIDYYQLGLFNNLLGKPTLHKELRMGKLDTFEMAALQLKLLGRKSRKRVLVSAGRPADKERMLPAITQLSQLSLVDIYATPGTSDFLQKHGIANQRLHKVSEGTEPNIKSALSGDRLDMIINVMTGVIDYDESTDSKLIRSLAIEHGILLITDVDVAIATIDQLVKRQQHDPFQLGPGRPEPWDLRGHFFEIVNELGGLSCHHAHFDKSFVINLENLALGQADMQAKWKLFDNIKQNYTHKDLVTRISRCLEMMISQGVTYCRTLVDADSLVKLLPIQAALEVKERYHGKIIFEVGTQPLKGVLDPESLHYFEQACEMADCIGGLPSRDRPLPEKHLDVIMRIANRLGKRLDVHVDQARDPDENETELLALKTIEHGLEGRVAAIHAVSLATKPKHEQARIIKLMKEAGLSVIVCPSAALSMKSLDKMAPLHNSIAPFVALLEAEVPLFLGIDNIADLFQPFVDANLWVELRLLMEACRFYDVRRVAEFACNRRGYAA